MIAIPSTVLRATVVLLLATLLPTIGWYHRRFAWHPLGSIALYFAIPVMTGWFLLGQSPVDYGLRRGDWQVGLLGTAIGMAFMTIVLLLLARQPAFTLYYGQAGRSAGDVVLRSGLHLFTWEFLFRGFVLFGLTGVFGPAAVVVQAVPFAMAHLGKPEMETLSTFFGGLAFGYLAWRTDSFLYGFVIHWYQMVLMIVLAQHAQEAKTRGGEVAPSPD